MSDEDRDQEDEQQPEEAAEEQQAPPQEPEDTRQAEATAQEAEAAPVVGFYDFLRYSAVSFAAEAWVALGIQVRPGADELENDLCAARTAIDTLEFLVGQLADELEAEEKQAFEAQLTDLRVNYVRRSSAEEKEE